MKRGKERVRTLGADNDGNDETIDTNHTGHNHGDDGCPNQTKSKSGNTHRHLRVKSVGNRRRA